MNNYLRLARYTVLGVSYRLNYRIDSKFQKDCSIRQSGIYFFLCYIHNPKIFLTMFKTIFEYPDPNVTSDSKGFIVKGNIKAIDQPSSSSSDQSSSNRTTTDTMGAFMKPTERWTNIFRSSRFDVQYRKYAPICDPKWATKEDGFPTDITNLD